MKECPFALSCVCSNSNNSPTPHTPVQGCGTQLALHHKLYRSSLPPPDQGLAEIHAGGRIHGDLRSPNIMLTGEGQQSVSWLRHTVVYAPAPILCLSLIYQLWVPDMNELSTSFRRWYSSTSATASAASRPLTWQGRCNRCSVFSWSSNRGGEGGRTTAPTVTAVQLRCDL